MKTYKDSLSLREARDLFFKNSGFDEKAYSEKWNKIKIGPLPFMIPNPPMRQRAIPLHDIHHILTGYETDLLGEGQISAWEMGSGGVGKYPLGYIYISLAIIGALFIEPKSVYGAYKRGRTSRNLFNSEFEDRLLSRTVGEMRRELRISA